MKNDLNQFIKSEARFETAELAQVEADKNNGFVVIKTSYCFDKYMIGRMPKVGDCLNQNGYTDVTPYKIVRLSKSGKTAYVKRVSSERDPNWKPEMEVGGFSAHCSNQHEQKWVYGDLEGDEISVRLNKNGWLSKLGRHTASSNPVRFYDYNF